MTALRCFLLAAVLGLVHCSKPVPPFDSRHELPLNVESEGHKIGIELGVYKGALASHMLTYWKQCTHYTLVDLWGSLKNYDDLANAEQAVYDRRYQATLEAIEPWKEKVSICRNYTTACAAQFRSHSVDFVYVDARHTRRGVLEDMTAYWPKIRHNGLLCGHDYLDCAEAQLTGQDWCLEEDGTRDPTGGAVKGAVNEFAAMHNRPVQLGTVELQWRTWCIRR